MKIPAAVSVDPHAPDPDSQLRELQPGPGVYLLLTSERAVHLSWSANLQRRLKKLVMASKTGSGVLLERVRKDLAEIRCWSTGSKLESSLLLYELAKAFFPADYNKRLRLRMPWFVALTSSSSFSRLAVRSRISPRDLAVFGPFQNRDAAQRYEEAVAGLFQLRRCVEPLLPDPQHPGCIYGEMKQCLRPCQCGVTADEYATEVHRAGDFLSTNGKSLVNVLAAARERACKETDFEQAAYIHKRIEKADAASATRDEVVNDMRQFSGLALTRGHQARQFRLSPVVDGLWQESITLDFSAEEAVSRSLDQELRERLDGALKEPIKNGNKLEHLALFSRWYFSSSRDGHWYPFRTLAELNYRRLVRQISRMAQSGMDKSM